MQMENCWSIGVADLKIIVHIYNSEMSNWAEIHFHEQTSVQCNGTKC